MSAAAAGIAENPAAKIAETIMPRRTPDGRSAVTCFLLAGGFAPLEVDVVISPWVLLVHGVLEPSYPGLHQNVLVAIRVIHPWRIRIDELRHPTKEPRALRTFGQLLRLLIELVEFRQVESRQVGDTGVRPIEERHEAEALGCRIDVAQEPHLELPVTPHLEQVGPLLRDEFHPDADRAQASLP